MRFGTARAPRCRWASALALTSLALGGACSGPNEVNYFDPPKTTGLAAAAAGRAGAAATQVLSSGGSAGNAGSAGSAASVATDGEAGIAGERAGGDVGGTTGDGAGGSGGVGGTASVAGAGGVVAASGAENGGSLSMAAGSGGKVEVGGGMGGRSGLSGSAGGAGLAGHSAAGATGGAGAAGAAVTGGAAGAGGAAGSGGLASTGGAAAMAGAAGSSSDPVVELHGTASASSSENQIGPGGGVHPASDANDGNETTTRWCAATQDVPAWWQLDLGASHPLSRVELVWEYPGQALGHVYGYTVGVSNNATQFPATPAVDQTANQSTAKTQLATFAAGTSGRYVRITVTSLPPDSNDIPPLETWPSFYEARVYGQ